MNIGRNIKTIRVSKNLSQKHLAAKVGITPTYLSLIENEVKKPSLTLIEKLSQVLDIPLTLLFGELTFSGVR
ncbi:MAG: helix-turn-helix transcriptional regulator [Candidatus Doudnabacteria bacterium]|nr:helix-turn-helix transcriptional regulator [Candidatus Doudnabacteria bacterium]